MTTEQALLHAIREEPGDDPLRLVLADWLEEAGQGPRAEFVRLQVRLAGLPKGDPDRAELERHEQGLLEGYGAEWLGPLAGLPGVEWSWRRGLLYAAVWESTSLR